MTSCRPAVLAVAVLLLAGCGAEPTAAGPADPPATPPPSSTASPGAEVPPVADPQVLGRFAALEEDFDARLGVMALDTGSGAVVEHRADERFAAASTLKAFSAAAVLDGDADLDRVVTWGTGDLVTSSPVTEQHVDDGLPLREVARAAAQDSDNTAANLLYDELGGPAALQDWLRDLGDTTTRADRPEPGLNDVGPGDERDTSTPRALAGTLERVLLGDALAVDDRELLDTWLRGTTTTSALVRAGVPDGWVVADKSGAAAYGTRDVVAVVRPPDRAPLVLALMSDRRDAGEDAAYDDALLAAATEVVVDALG